MMNLVSVPPAALPSHISCDMSCLKPPHLPLPPTMLCEYEGLLAHLVEWMRSSTLSTAAKKWSSLDRTDGSLPFIRLVVCCCQKCETCRTGGVETEWALQQTSWGGKSGSQSVCLQIFHCFTRSSEGKCSAYRGISAVRIAQVISNGGYTILQQQSGEVIRCQRNTIS
jgi:hypothetical protein